jgi:hypothetical protein
MQIRSHTFRAALGGLGALALVAFTGCTGSEETAPEEATPAEQPEQAEPARKEPPKIDKSELEKDAENKALVPSPAEMQMALDRAGIQANLADMVADRELKMDVPNTDQVAVRTGVVIADMLLTVKGAKKPKLIKDLGKIKAGMVQLGAGSDIPAVIDDLADRIKNDAVSREDLVKELDELSGAVIPEIEYEAGDRSVPLIQAGSWLEGANLVSKAINDAGKYEAAGDLLKQPSVVAYFQQYVATEGRDKAPSEVIDQLERTLKTLEEIVAKPSLGEDDVKKIEETTAAVLDLL